MGSMPIETTIQQLVASFNGRNRGRWRACFSAEAELALTLGLGTETYRGREGAEAWFDSMPALWAEFEVTLRHIDLIDADTAVAELHATGLGTRPGIVADATLYLGITAEHEEVARFVVSNDRERVITDL